MFRLKAISILLSLVYLFTAVQGGSCYGWGRNDSLDSFRLKLKSEDAFSKQEIVHDDFGGVITESEIWEYAHQGDFWSSVSGGIVGMVMGGSLGFILGGLIYDRSDPMSGVSMFTYEIGGAIIGFFSGLALSQSNQTNGRKRSETIDLIRRKRIENKKNKEMTSNKARKVGQ